MTATTTLAHLTVDATPDGDVERRLEMALRLAAEFGGGLTAVCSAWPASSSLADALTHNPFSSIGQERDLRNEISRVEAVFDRLTEGTAINVHWCASISHPGTNLLDHALLADLTIMSMSPPSDFARADLLEVAARSGSPILRLGTESQTTSFENILIGWKDSREAHCALRAALPFLQRAGKITLAGVGDEVSAARLANVGEYLSDYGAKLSILHLANDKTSPGAMLAGLARDEGCDLVVAGARAQGLWKERIFGGATRDLLDVAEINWLLAN